MAKETTEKKLYDLLTTRDYNNFQAIDSRTGKVPVDPESGAQDVSRADMFTFDWNSSRGKNYGTAVVLLTPEHELELYFGDNLGKTMENLDDKNEWFAFMEQLRHFATRTNFNGFRPLNINQLRHSLQGQAAIKEGLFESWQGRRNMSWSAGPTEARLVIKHKRNLDPGDARHLYIESLFIETADSERYKLKFNSLKAGRAMLEHVRQGGRPYDIRGQHITDIVEELNVLGRFERGVSRETVLEGDTAQLVSDAAVYRKTLKENLKRMGTSRGYSEYFETWNPVDISEQHMVIESLKHMFVKQTLDARIEQALPLLARIQQQGNAMKEATIFENWAHRLVEGTWSMPDTPEAQQKLLDFMSQEQPVGADATDATEQLYDLLGDDELFDQLQDLAQEDPNADCRQLVLDRMQELSDEPDIRAVLEKLNTDTEINTTDNMPTDMDNDEESNIKESLSSGQYHVWTVHFDDGTTGKIRITWDETSDEDIKAHYAKKGKTVVRIDHDWAVHDGLRRVTPEPYEPGGSNNRGRGVSESSNSRAAMIQKLENIYIELYQDEDPESYDIPGAVMYWRSLPPDQLAAELADAEEKLSRTDNEPTDMLETKKKSADHRLLKSFDQAQKSSEASRIRAARAREEFNKSWDAKKTAEKDNTKDIAEDAIQSLRRAAGIKESNMSEIDIVRQDCKSMSDAEFKKAHKMTKKEWRTKHADIVKESVLRDSAGGTLDHIADTFKRDLRDFEETGNLSNELYDALYDYYVEDMPYGVQKARTGDPYQWVADRVTADLDLGTTNLSPWQQFKSRNDTARREAGMEPNDWSQHPDFDSDDFKEERDPHSVDGGMANSLLYDDAVCNMTEAGDTCPVHGIDECWSAMSNEGILGTIAGGVAGAALGGPLGALTGAAAGDQLTDEGMLGGLAGGALGGIATKSFTGASAGAKLGSALQDRLSEKDDASPLAGQYGHSGRMTEVGRDTSWLDRLKELSGMKPS